jgi:hypothetical protein
MIERTWGVTVAAQVACTTRIAISAAGVGASPHSIEASVNPAIPRRKTRFRPKMSPSLPPDQEHAKADPVGGDDELQLRWGRS